MAKLFEKVKLRDVEIRNRTIVSPMCMYSAKDGLLNDFHLVHIGKFALGGAGLIFIEATGVSPEGRITHGDSGLWNDEQIEPLKRVVDFMKAHNTTPGIQLAHAGRKASAQRPWEGGGPLTEKEVARGELPWITFAPSAVPFEPGWIVPKAMNEDDMAKVKADFVAAAKRALKAGFEVLEMHNAHGYLLQSFLSPIANRRDDKFGGTLENRMRFPLEVATALRETWPADKPMFVRVSSVDGVEGGFSIDDAITYARELKKIGVDVIDCSSGGQPGKSTIRPGFGYQVPYAKAIREQAEIKTAAVGLIVEAKQAEKIIEDGEADFVALAREALNEPFWFVHAQQELGQVDEKNPYGDWPEQYAFWLEKRKHTLDRLAGKPKEEALQK